MQLHHIHFPRFIILIIGLFSGLQIHLFSESIDPPMIHGIAIPSDFPELNISVNTSPDTSNIFVGVIGDPSYKLILDNDGGPVWFEKKKGTLDFKLQPNGWLTYFDGETSIGAAFVALDSTYTPVHLLTTPPGYLIDPHECQVTSDGHYFLIGNKSNIVDMSAIVPGGNPKAVVRKNYVIEMDENDQPVFIWGPPGSLFKITDAIYEDLTQEYIDYLHMNAIAVDLDGNLLVSLRNLSEVVKIDRNNGSVIWRLGGAHDSFAWNGNVEKFSYQHDIRALPNGHYTVFDNGCHHSWHYSRALEISLDLETGRATTVWEYRNDPNFHSRQQGSFQMLPSGNRVICWGDWGYPIFTEVNPDGDKVFEFSMAADRIAYRSFRFPWHGVAVVPQLLLEPYLDRLTLIFNQFGATDIAYFNIYASEYPGADQLIATTPQPFYHIVSEIPNEKETYFRVASVNTKGVESQFSNEESVFFQVLDPSANLIKNGDFNDGKNNWFIYQGSGASAAWNINASGELQLNIDAGGAQGWHLSVRQLNIPLVLGRTYKLEFDAYADAGRIFSVDLEKATSPYTNYSRLGSLWIDGKPTRYSQQFTMESPTDAESLLSLNAGMSTVDLYLDNLSLTMLMDENTIDAAFSVTPASGSCPLTVQFNDESVGDVVSWLWDFGDGETSTEQNPLHVYQSADTFTVSLQVAGVGGTDSETKSDFIAVYVPAPIADFIADTTSGVYPLTVQFYNQSSGSIDSFFWEFGDGEISTDQNPVHVYTYPDSFTVNLTVNGPGGMNSQNKEGYIITFEASPGAAFSVDTAFGLCPLTVQFTDQSIGAIDSWSWDFGDGEISSEQNPIHTYLYPDSFTVSLTVAGPGGTDTLQVEDCVIVEESTGIQRIDEASPDHFALLPNYPNPFNSETIISFSLPKPSPVKIAIYDLSGKYVESLLDHFCEEGTYQLRWNACFYSAGIYIVTIRAGEFSETKKALLVK